MHTHFIFITILKLIQNLSLQDVTNHDIFHSLNLKEENYYYFVR